MIRILKASAGSGKTWNLALEYIKILLKARDAHAYRHILAVTFTAILFVFQFKKALKKIEPQDAITNEEKTI